MNCCVYSLTYPRATGLTRRHHGIVVSLTVHTLYITAAAITVSTEHAGM